MTPDLECSALTKRFGDTTAVENVSFQVPPGSFFSILGPSGCGKTTIMRMIAGFLEPSEGDIRIKGKSVLNVAPNKRPVNMVFQHLALFPMMNIAENIGYGLRRQGMDKTQIGRKVDEALDRIGLPGIGSRKVDELSGGQKQRVAIARCMVLEPDVLLLDEPLGALDLKLRERMKVELKSLQAAFDTTFVYITHDQSEALVMSDNIAVMNNGQFEQMGSGQDLYYRPESAFVAGFVGDTNRWQGKVTRKEGDAIELVTENGLTLRGATHGRDLSDGQQADVFVRPEAIRIAHDAADLAHFDNRISGRVTSLLFNGAASRILVGSEDGREEIEVNLPQSGEFSSIAKGDAVHIGWASDQGNCFKAGGN
ncbi:Spermidine/putrescine import ATP-binding protein PotA [Thalassovita autumnalis]|uniref:Spermidine/putrescine import ATP-binding protein PotA n=1 Tax=Thalassovita autumnalis TaxID=2072972 RepID=A0A0P1G4Z9_9RHOB|nr:ABC transporter ATP-binding protein [Thalassovita autumnalis]CUH69327.1 Spermidine/putrescine import ATP-binding protein PotA [Thalassovita autumnalis]CUH74250.1 Spermidine/putrescine import ATP-binding protein PotA [Thalassovita autumnalis]